MTDRVCLALRVPADDVDRFEDYLVETYGMKAPYAGIEIERELRTLRDNDDLAALEDEVDRLLRAAGRRPIDTQEKNILSRSASDGPTTVKNYRIHEDVREWFVANHDNPGRVLGRLMRYIADGGTVARLVRRFRRVADDAEALLADLADGDGSVGPKERRRRNLFTRLAADGTPFTTDDFDRVVDDHLTGIDSGDYARDEHLQPVLDRADYTEHPLNPDLYVPAEQAREIADSQGVPGPDSPSIDRFKNGGLRYDDLTRDDKIRGLRIEAARRATSRGTAAIHTTDVVDDVFDGKASPTHAAGLIVDAADTDGFDVDTKRGTKRLTVDLRAVTDADVLEHVDTDESGRSSSASAAEPPGSTAEDTGDDGTDDPIDVEAEADAEMNRLLSATPATDGGEPVDGEP